MAIKLISSYQSVCFLKGDRVLKLEGQVLASCVHVWYDFICFHCKPKSASNSSRKPGTSFSYSQTTFMFIMQLKGLRKGPNSFHDAFISSNYLSKPSLNPSTKCITVTISQNNKSQRLHNPLSAKLTHYIFRA